MAKNKTVTKVKKAEKVAKTLPELRADLQIARKSLMDGTLQNPHAISAIKKEIARALTKENAEKKGEK